MKVRISFTQSRATLDEVPAGATAVIEAVRDARGAAPDDTLLRLREMGMTPNTVVTVTRRALFGDPVEVKVRGTRLCLRRRHAACFAMKPVDDDSPSSGGGA